jgi:hypothetical protein
MAVTAFLSFGCGSIANQPGPSAADETEPAMSTVLSLDNFNGGYKGWGPMANLLTPSSGDESYPFASVDQERDHELHLADVNIAREQVWIANAPLRAEYENIGATRSEGRGSGQSSDR